MGLPPEEDRLPEVKTATTPPRRLASFEGVGALAAPLFRE
jgi:hypothetical protein